MNSKNELVYKGKQPQYPYKTVFVIIENKCPIAIVIGRKRFAKIQELWYNYTKNNIIQNYTRQSNGLISEYLAKGDNGLVHYYLYELVSERMD